jgi:hypothetical protein
LFLATASAFGLGATELHVSQTGAGPYKTISAAAQAAQPGDTITVHAGIYREKIVPPRGGASDTQRITYQAAPGEKVSIRGSEVVKGWKPFMGKVWKATLPNSFFGSYNPYKDLLEGDWFTDKGRPHHTGDVYLNGQALFESSILERLLNPTPYKDARDQKASLLCWYAEVDEQNTHLYANFGDKDPNAELVEINVRDAVFYPDKPGVNFITIRGFHMSHAATQWAAPTAEQPGLIGTHWSKGWLIENNVISDSKCSGITLGKDRKTGHNVWIHDPAKPGHTHYNEVIDRALKNGWTKLQIGSHIVRNNTIFNCEQTGIAGSLGAVFSQIYDNHIYNIWAKRQFTGAEMAGIKLHAAIDVVIRHNRIHNAGRGLWMDWMAQGTRITGNLLYDNTTDDLYVEVNHGPFLVDNNLFLSPVSLWDMSECGAYVHNLMTGEVRCMAEPNRDTPYHPAHSTEVVTTATTKGGDNRFYNNVFFGAAKEIPPPAGPWYRRMVRGFGTAAYNDSEFPSFAAGNVYFNGAKPYAKEAEGSVASAAGKVELVDEGASVYLVLDAGDALPRAGTRVITTAILGKAKVPQVGYENPDGTPLTVNTDYLGKARSGSAPTAGPFEKPGSGSLRLKLW